MRHTFFALYGIRKVSDNLIGRSKKIRRPTETLNYQDYILSWNYIVKQEKGVSPKTQLQAYTLKHIIS